MAEDTLLLPPMDGPVSGGGDDVLLLPPLDEADAGGGVLRRRRVARPSTLNGSVGVWLMDMCPYESASSSAEPPRLGGSADRRRVTGLAVVEWMFRYPIELDDDEDWTATVKAAGSGAVPWGRVDYVVHNVQRLQESVLVNVSEVDADPTLACLYRPCAGLRLEDGATVADYIAENRPTAFCTTLELDADFMAQAFAGENIVLRKVPLGVRVRYEDMLFGVPTKALITQLRRDVGVERESRAPAPTPDETRKRKYEEIALQLPGKRSKTSPEDERGEAPRNDNDDPKDAVRILYALDFAKYLRSVYDFGEAGTAWERFKTGGELEEPRSKDRDPPRTRLQRGRQRLDLVTCLIERREYHAALANGEIYTIGLYTDGSPVKGNEIQGLVMDVTYTDGRKDTVIMPGASLSYGHTDCINKTAALLFSFWLLFGPGEDTMRLALNLVRYVTTDGGIEIATTDAPNFLPAFLARMRGESPQTCKGLVKHGERLFPLALKLYGWSHLWGNVMKTIGKSNEHWPSILEAARDLCSFYRLGGWRDHLALMLRPQHTFDLSPLKSFSAGFAKWRYETITVVFESLVRLRQISEKGVRSEFFENFQDRALLTRVLKWCADAPLWVFLAVSASHIFTPCERIRRWGMVCNCEKHLKLRAEGVKHIHCARNGRRLKEAYAEAMSVADDFKNLAKHFPPDACEGYNDVHRQVCNMLLRAESIIRLRFHYLGQMPWAFVNADTVAGAQAVVRLMEAAPLDKHDPLSRDLWRRLEGDTRRRAAGEPASDALKRECKLMDEASLDEGAGEGYHRSTNGEATRAHGSRMMHLKGNTRHKQCLRKCRAFIANRRSGQEDLQVRVAALEEDHAV